MASGDQGHVRHVRHRLSFINKVDHDLPHTTCFVPTGASVRGAAGVVEGPQELAGPLGGPDVVRFLRHLLRHIPGLLLVIWDGAPIHHGQAVKDFLASGGTARLQLEVLPGYAPDLNPDEGIWNYLKRVELRNRCCATLRQLHYALRLATARLRHKRPIMHSCFHQAGYRV